MKISGILLLFFLFPSISFPAEFKERVSRKERVRLADSLNKLAEISLENNPENTKLYASEAFSISVQINHAKGQIDALKSLANYYLTREDYSKTFDAHFKIIDLYNQSYDYDSLVLGYSQVVQLFLLIKDYDLAKKYIGTMSQAAQKAKDPSSRGQVFFYQAKYYLSKGDYDPAIRYFYLSILLFQKANDPCKEGAVYKFLGDAFVQKKLYAQAEYNYRQAISVFERVPNPAELAVIYTRIAHIKQVLANYKSNLVFNLSAMRIREKIGHSKLISSSYLNVGEAYWLLGRKDSAGFFFRKSLQLAEHVQSTVQLAAIYSQLSNFAVAEKRYQDGLNYYMAYAEYRTKMNHDRNQSDISILEANRTIRAGEIKNDLMKQEMQIQGLQIRNRRIQIFLFEVTFISMLSLILIMDALARKNRKRKNELKDLNSQLTDEIIVRVEAERRLNRSIELHQFLAENTGDVISLSDAGMHIIYISPSCEKFYGYTPYEILQMGSLLDLVIPTFHITVNQRLLEMFRSKKSTRYIYKVKRKDGSVFWAEANINPIIDTSTHNVKHLITVVRDISERMKYEEELSENSRQKEYLLREIHNRVKNNFAILITLMCMQRDQSSNAELYISLTDLQFRVRTMSLVHEQLYQTQDISIIPFDSYLHHLSNIISSSFNNSRIHLMTDIAPCKIAIELALPLGLIINELITNAYKYAFPGDLTGHIWVRLLPENEEKFYISICDDGVGLPADFTMNSTHSMGLQIVKILIEQIEAKLVVSGDRGSCFSILFSTAQENRS